MRFVEDPSVAAAARVEHAEMMRAILARYEAGEDYFVAREAVMAEHGPRIAKELGKEAAKRALETVCSHHPANLPRASRLAHSAAMLDAWLAHTDRWQGPGHYWTWRQRLTIRALGVSHWPSHPLGGVVWLAGTAAGVAAAWWCGPLSLPGGAGAVLAALLTLDVVINSAAPAGKNLTGPELEAWLAERAAEEERRIDAEMESALTEQAAQENERAKWRAAQRAIGGYARQMDKDADARATSILPEAPPLDDAGKVIMLRGRGR